MTHPEDLLADHVDGTLSQTERAVLDAHLTGCETCREEVALAGGAVTALTALDEEPVPFGVTGPVLAEARRTAQRRAPTRERFQWAIGLAAAACLVLVAVVLLPQLTGGPAEDRGALSAGGGDAERSEDATLGAEALAPLQLEVSDENFAEQDLARLARTTAKVAPALPLAPTASFAAPDEAINCMVESGATIDEADVLVRVIQARYLGTPAYIGVFHEGAGGGAPAQRVVVWVISSADCAILTLLSRNI
jgi:anti-sigma factor RsiW